MPEPGDLQESDRRLLAEIESGFDSVGEAIESARFKAALGEAMRLASLVNQYTSEQAPWALMDEDRERAGTIFYVSLRAIDSLKTMFTPFLPFSSQVLHELLGYEGTIAGPLELSEVGEAGDEHEVLTGDYESWGGTWAPTELPAGQELRKPRPLFEKLDPDKVEFKAYQSPSAKPGSPLPGAYGLAVAGDGSVWWAEDEADKMARVDPATGQVEEFKIPYNEGHAFPRRMNTDANGDLWVALWNAGKLMKIDHKSKQMTIYSPPSQTGGNYSVVVDKKNNFIWVSEHQVDKIARFDPRTREWVEFPMAEAESDPRRIDIDPTNPNRIFFAGNIPGRVGFIEVLP